MDTQEAAERAAYERVNDRRLRIADDVFAVRDIPRQVHETRHRVSMEIERTRLDTSKPVAFRRATVEALKEELRKTEQRAGTMLDEHKAAVRASREKVLMPPTPTAAQMQARHYATVRAAQLEGRFQAGAGNHDALAEEIAGAIREGSWDVASALLDVGRTYAPPVGSPAAQQLVQVEHVLAEYRDTQVNAAQRQAMVELEVIEAERIPTSEAEIRSRFPAVGSAPELEFPEAPSPGDAVVQAAAAQAFVR